jgi:lipopolysaccharide export system permease protein
MTQILLRADRYLLRQMLPRMGAALTITLVALLFERILRLLSFVTGHGADLTPILALALNLLPHYLGLALPAAFCIAVLSSLFALSKNNELDMLESAGWSIRRVGASYVAMSVVFCLLSVLLFGVIQPYSRFAFSEIQHEIINAGWSGRLEQGIFLDLGQDTTLSAGEIDATGRILTNVFLVQGADPKRQTATTAVRAVVVPDASGHSVHLVLTNGRSLGGDGSVLEFDELILGRKFDLDNTPFRPRGGSERELTLGELWDQMEQDGPAVEPRIVLEFHSRLVRAFSLIGFALISIPLAVSRKRSPGWQRIGIAVVILAVYDNLIKLIGSMAQLGQIDPVIGMWGLWAGFMCLGLWLFITTPGQGAVSPFWALYRMLSRVFGDGRVPPS